LNWLDYVLLFLVCASVISGFAKGLTRVVIGFVALLLGVFCSLAFYRTAAVFFQDFGLSRTTADFAGFFAIFFGILILGGLIGAIVCRLLKAVGLGWMDRLAGGAIGLVRGVIIGTVVITALMAFTPKPPPGSVKTSKLAPYLLGASGMIVTFAPVELKQGYDKSRDKLMQVWEGFKAEKF
jgi:membrane protein required for colicin V production